MGKSGKKLINVSIIITQAGFGIAYLIFIPENIQKVLCYETDQTVCPSTISITFFTVLALLPFVFLQNMKTLVIPTLLANVSLLIGISWGYLNAFGWTPEARSNADEIGEAAMPEGRSRGGFPKFFATKHHEHNTRTHYDDGGSRGIRDVSEAVVDPETKKAEDAAALKHIEQKTKQDLTKKDKEKLEQLKPPSFVAFNFAQYPIFFGIAVFAFEGIGLLLPCQRAMQKPARMHAVVTKCMWFLTVLFVSFGLSCYVRWGGKPLDEETVQDRRLVEDFDLSGPDVVPGWRNETIGVQAMVTFNYPESTITSFVILFYVLGIFFSFPVMMFPVFTLLENSLFIRSQCCLPHRKVIKRVGRKVAGWCFGGEDRFRSWYYVESTKEDAMAEEEDAMSDFEDDDEQEYFSEEAGGDVEQLRQRREVDPDTFAIEDDDDEDNDNEDNESENRRAASRNSVSAKVPAALPGTTAQGVAATSGIVATGLPSTSAPAFRAQDTAPDGDGRSSSDSPATRPPRTSSRMVVGALPSKEGALRPAPDMGVATVVGRPIDGTGTAGPTTATAASPEIPSLPRRRSSRRRSSAGSLNITVVPFLNLYEKCLLRVIVTILAALTALTIPHFGLFLSLLGSITCNLLAFILPAYFHYYMTVVVVGKNTTEDANLNDHTLDVHAATPREDVFYAGFGILAGLWSFVVTTAEFF
eukprot:g11769.t1